MTKSFKLVSNIRTLTAAHAARPSDSDMRRKFSLNVTPTADTGETGATTSFFSEIYGAGDVISVDNAMIAHVEPANGSGGVEPNYCPYVEFIDADFPWRYSFDTSQSAQVKPWLCLLALKNDEFKSLGQASSMLERIQILNATESLPDLAQSWAWAHVQFKGDNTDALQENMQNSIGDTMSRLLCVRALEDMTDYTLMLVPVYEQGRLRGLGRNETIAEWDQLSWASGADNVVELPVYAKWRFTTSASEDFESLANRLKPVAEDDAADIGSTKPVFIGNVGEPLTFSDDALSMAAEGALQTPNFKRQKTKDDAQIKSELANELNMVLDYMVLSEEEDSADNEDPLVSLPVYGAHYKQSTSISDTGDEWFDEVNLDLRFRYGAGAGARIVKRHQETFMQACWEQVHAVMEQKKQRSLLQVSDLLSHRIVDKTLKKLSPEISISLMQNIHSVTAIPGTSEKTVADQIHDIAMPRGYTERCSRRVFSRKATVFSKGNPAEGVAQSCKLAMPTLPGDTAIGTVRETWAIRSELDKETAIRRRQTHFVTTPNTASESTERRRDSNADHNTMGTISALVSRPIVSVGTLSASSLAAATSERLINLPREKAKFIFDQSDDKALEDQVVGPVLGDGIAHYLMEEDAALLIPGAEDLPANSVVLLQENRKFLESAMVGANHEMMHELLWREYPADIGATVFHRFWEKGVDAKDTEYDDIKDIHKWQRKLGANTAGRAKPKMIMILRGDIVRRYPNMIAALDHQPKADETGWDNTNSSLLEPVFQGTLDAQTVYFGFDITEEKLVSNLEEYFFMLFEPQGRFRFGLDTSDINKVDERKRSFEMLSFKGAKRNIGTHAISSRKKTITTETAETVDDLSWAHIKPSASGYINTEHTVSVDGKNWGSERDLDSANLAKALFQKPVCVIIPAKELIDA